jgi:hypothetical protein
VAVRLEPIILELEREQNDLLIIAHESVLRVLYGYLMACNAADIPFLSFPRDEIIEVSCLLPCSKPKADHHGQIIPASYNNEAKRIKIPNLPPDIIPASPEGIKVPAPPSGFATPVPGLGSGLASPRTGRSTPEPGSGSGHKTPEDSELTVRMHDVV